MDFRTLLRAALIPLGASLVMRGLSDLRAEADELAELVDARRAYLAGEGPLPEVDEPPAADDDEHQDAAPVLENFRITSNGNPVTRRPRRWPLWAALGLGVGYVAARSAVHLAARAELAAAESLDITAALMRQPPAPGSPADLAAPALVTRSAVCSCGGPIGPDGQCVARVRDEPGYDEHQAAAEFPHADTAAVGGPGDPYVCNVCAWIAPAGERGTRNLALILHRNSHAAGIPGR